MRHRVTVAAIGLVLVAELVIAAVVLARVRPPTADDDGTIAGPVPIGFSLDRMPVPGWRLTATDIGLPSDVPVGESVTTIGDRAYFVTGCDSDCLNKRCNLSCEDPRGWLYGIDLKTGARLFKPVLLDGFHFSSWFQDCRPNGRSVAVCVDNEVPSKGKGRVWVVDLNRGAVTYSGPTDMWQENVPGSGPQLERVGNPRGQTRLVASVGGKGVYGIGSHAELTWFVPGSGHLVAPMFDSDNGSGLTLATQIPAEEDPRYRVFSVIDGSEKTPAPPPGVTLRRAITYDGGFAYQYEDGNTVGVMFYDPAGHLLARRELKSYNLLEHTAMPVVLDQSVFRIYAPDGREVMTLPATAVYHTKPMFPVLGDYLYLTSPENFTSHQSWQRWNLNTGEPAVGCHDQAALSDYVGGNGRILLFEDQEARPISVAAVDVTTCQTLWRLTQPGRHRIRQVGASLIDLSPDEIELLRAP